MGTTMTNQGITQGPLRDAPKSQASAGKALGKNRWQFNNETTDKPA
jgi:ABC-type amino acid transport system permease subunit